MTFGAIVFSPLLKIVEDNTIIVLPHLVGQQTQKRIGLLLSNGPLGISIKKKIRHGCRDRSVLENLRVHRIFGSRHYRAALNPGRDKNSRDTDTEAVKCKGLACPRGIGGCGLTIRSTNRRNDVIVNAAVLIVYNEQDSILPKSRIGTDGVVDVGDEPFSFAHVVIRVLVGG